MSIYRDYLAGQQEFDRRKRNRKRRKILLMLIFLVAVTGSIYCYHNKIDTPFTGGIEAALGSNAGNKISDNVVAVFDEIVAGNADSMDWFSNAMTKIPILGDCSFGDRKLPIYSVDTEEKKIAISFDAAWGAEDFERIMEVLDAHNVKTTFFMTGGWVEANPDCVKELVEKGHDLGNHSEHHYDMATLSKEEIESELMEVHDKVSELTGYDMKLFRPPYGSYNNEVIDTAYDCGYYPIQWSVDSLDWKDYGVKSIIDTVCNHEAMGPGAIILCHNGAAYTADALDELLTNLENQGYEFVKISDLIMTENYHMDAAGRQIAD